MVISNIIGEWGTVSCCQLHLLILMHLNEAAFCSVCWLRLFTWSARPHGRQWLFLYQTETMTDLDCNWPWRGKCSFWCWLVKWIYRQIRNNKQTEELLVHFPCFVCLYLKTLFSLTVLFFLYFSLNSYAYTLYLSLYVIGLPLPRLAQ